MARSPAQTRSDQIDPMLASRGGPTFHFGVGCAVVCDFKRGCDGELPDSIALWMDVDRVFRDRRLMHDATGDPIHLKYEKKIKAEIRKKGRQNPEVRGNYYLEDTVEEGNFISRERLLSCARGRDIIVPTDGLYVGID